MARGFYGEIVSLHTAAQARVDLWVFCRHRGRAGWFVPIDLARMLQKCRPKDEYVAHLRLDEVARYMRCTKCKQRAAVIVPKYEPLPWLSR